MVKKKDQTVHRKLEAEYGKKGGDKIFYAMNNLHELPSQGGKRKKKNK